MKAPKAVSLILPYNAQGEILLQNRIGISKWGEEYALFGGTIEPEETPEHALIRELGEELEWINPRFRLFKRYNHTNTEFNVTVDRSIYLSDMPDLKKLVCHEGKIEVRRFDNSMDLKMIPGFNELLAEIYDSVRCQLKI